MIGIPAVVNGVLVALLCGYGINSPPSRPKKPLASPQMTVNGARCLAILLARGEANPLRRKESERLQPFP
jgi:hypothetical protein